MLQHSRMSWGMREPAGMLDELRRDVLVALLNWCSVATVLIVPVQLFDAFAQGVAPVSLVALNAWLFLLPLLRVYAPRLGQRRTVLLLVAHIFVALSWVQLFRGLMAGSALGNVAIVLLAALFFGHRGWVLALAVCGLSVTAAAVVTTQGLVVPWDARLWDPVRPLVWARYLLIFAFLGGGLAMAIVRMLRGLDEAATRLQESLASERRERARREAAQRAVEHAKRVEALAQLASGMAHDFNNSLQVVTVAAELIGNGASRPELVRSLARDILDAAEASIASIAGLMSLGRKSDRPPSPVKVHELVQRLETPLRYVLSDHVSLTLQLASDGQVLVDPGRLQQALLNLALNARDAMDASGHLSIDVRDAELAQGPDARPAGAGRFVVIAMSDNGAGMDEVTRGRLFEPFFTTKEPGKGTGLGLVMVRSFVEDAGGFMEIESELGRGTTMRIYLPVLQLGSASALDAAKVDTPARPPPNRASN